MRPRLENSDAQESPTEKDFEAVNHLLLEASPATNLQTVFSSPELRQGSQQQQVESPGSDHSLDYLHQNLTQGTPDSGFYMGTLTQFGSLTQMGMTASNFVQLSQSDDDDEEEEEE